MADGNLASYLVDLGFPAWRGEIRDNALQNGAPQSVLDAIDKMPTEKFDKLSDVTSEYNDVDSPFAT